MIGRAKEQGEALDELFNDARYALPPLTSEEQDAPETTLEAPRPVRLDVPDWCLEQFDESLGQDADAILSALRSRAPVTLRANTTKTNRESLISELTADGFQASVVDLAQSAVVVSGNARALSQHAAYLEGRFEFQDASSQAAVEGLQDLMHDACVLDYCAGGGGKSLALAALGAGKIVAHDADYARMNDLDARANRAGAVIAKTATPSGTFDVVLCDVPCSGSGAWRRQPDAKWRLTPDRLKSLTELQGKIVDDAIGYVRDGGYLVYMTCSLFDVENAEQIDNALRRISYLSEVSRRRFTPLDGGDGFFVAVLKKQNAHR